MAIPYEPLLALMLALFVGLSVAWLAAPRLGRGRLSGNAKEDGRLERAVRLGCSGLLALLILGLVVAGSLGAPLVPWDQPASFGHSWSVGGPDLVAVDTTTHQYYVAYQPGVDVRVAISLSNTGGAPITILGLTHPAVAVIRSVELRLPPGGPTTDLTEIYPDQVPPGSDHWDSQPFKAFVIGAHAEVALVLSMTVGSCPAAVTLPTLAPGTSLAPKSDASLYAGLGSLDGFVIEYSALGISRTASIHMPFTIAFVGGSGSGSCG